MKRIPGRRLLSEESVLNVATLLLLLIWLCVWPLWFLASSSCSSALSTSISSSPCSLPTFPGGSSLTETADWAWQSMKEKKKDICDSLLTYTQLKVALKFQQLNAYFLYALYQYCWSCKVRQAVNSKASHSSVAGWCIWITADAPDLLSCLTHPDFSRSSLYSLFSCLTIFLLWLDFFTLNTSEHSAYVGGMRDSKFRLTPNVHKIEVRLMITWMITYQILLSCTQNGHSSELTIDVGAKSSMLNTFFQADIVD